MSKNHEKTADSKRTNIAIFSVIPIFLFALSEAISFHRVAIGFEVKDALLCFGAASLLSLFIFFCSALSFAKIQNLRFTLVWLVPIIITANVIIYFEIGADGIWLVPPIAVGVLLAAIRGKDADLRFDRLGFSLPVIAFAVLTATDYPGTPIIGCLILMCIIHIVTVAYIRGQNLAKFGEISLLILACFTAGMPWILPALYTPLKHF